MIKPPVVNGPTSIRSYSFLLRLHRLAYRVKYRRSHIPVCHIRIFESLFSVTSVVVSLPSHYNGIQLKPCPFRQRLIILFSRTFNYFYQSFFVRDFSPKRLSLVKLSRFSVSFVAVNKLHYIRSTRVDPKSYLTLFGFQSSCHTGHIPYKLF